MSAELFASICLNCETANIWNRHEPCSPEMSRRSPDRIPACRILSRISRSPVGSSGPRGTRAAASSRREPASSRRAARPLSRWPAPTSCSMAAESPLTQTFGLGMSGEVSDAQLDDIETFFRSRERPDSITKSVRWPTTKLIATLHARGYEPFEFTSVMSRPLAKTGEPGAAAPGVTVRVATAAEHERWAQTAAAGWDEAPELGQFMLGVRPDHCGQRRWLAVSR